MFELKKKDLCVESVMWCVFQRKSWKRRFFTLDDNTVSYYKSEMVRSQILFFFFLYFLSLSCVTVVFVCPCLNCACVCGRIRSLSELFRLGTYRRSTNVSSSRGESSVNHRVKFFCHFNFSLHLVCVWSDNTLSKYEQYLNCWSLINRLYAKSMKM